MANHPKRSTVNAQEAAAFVTHCRIEGLSTAAGLKLLAETTWPDLREDLACGRRRHTPTIRRLAKHGILELDSRHAAAAAYRDEIAADRARWVALPDGAKADVRAAVGGAAGNESNKRARAVAASLGITIHARSIDDLRALIDPRRPWNSAT